MLPHRHSSVHFLFINCQCSLTQSNLHLPLETSGQSSWHKMARDKWTWCLFFSSLRSQQQTPQRPPALSVAAHAASILLATTALQTVSSNLHPEQLLPKAEDRSRNPIDLKALQLYQQPAVAAWTLISERTVLKAERTLQLNNNLPMTWENRTMFVYVHQVCAPTMHMWRLEVPYMCLPLLCSILFFETGPLT